MKCIISMKEYFLRILIQKLKNLKKVLTQRHEQSRHKKVIYGRFNYSPISFLSGKKRLNGFKEPNKKFFKSILHYFYKTEEGDRSLLETAVCDYLWSIFCMHLRVKTWLNVYNLWVFFFQNIYWNTKNGWYCYLNNQSSLLGKFMLFSKTRTFS